MEKQCYTSDQRSEVAHTETPTVDQRSEVDQKERGYRHHGFHVKKIG